MLSGAMLVGGWLAWACYSRIEQVEVSDSARVEVSSYPVSLQANFSGRIRAVHMTLGATVRSGDILVEGDTREEQLALAEQVAKESALGPRIDALRSEISAESGGASDDGSVLRVSSENGQAQVRQADADWELADKERLRAQQLKADGIISDADAQRAMAAAESKRAALEALRHSLGRLGPEYKLRQRTREAHLDDLRGQQAALEGELATAEAERRRLEYEIERRTVRAPVSGRLGECLPLASGEHLNEGDKLGVILPSDRLHVVAEFAPAAAFGKVRAGQAATLRLDGFPWTQYGVVRARVSKVATEIRDGKVRVELAVLPGGHPDIILQHGLPGSVEIETERISPLALLLRTAGDLAGKS